VVEGTTDADIAIDIYGAKEATIDTITRDLYNISNHPGTTAMVNWNPAPSGAVGDATTAEQTPDISAIITEIVAQDGWVAGNNIMIVCTGDAALTDDVNREFESYEGSPTGAPVLNITYAAGGITALKTEQVQIPSRFMLKQNYPNPFNPSTTISFSLPEISDVKLSVYNILGQKVAELVNQKMNAGMHKITWDAQNLASGVYIIAFKANSTFMTKKMNLIK